MRSPRYAVGPSVACLAALALILTPAARAQTPVPESDFNPLLNLEPSGVFPGVTALAIQPDGRIVAGGSFSITNVPGALRTNLARLLPNGTLDTTFNAIAWAPSGAGDAMALAVQPDGKILVGGNFTTLNGQARLRIGRLNPDGTIDPTFNPAADSFVYAFAVQPDGKILVSGNFTTLGGLPRNGVGRLNADGTIDPSFNAGAGGGRIFCVALQPDGKVLVAGSFTSIGGLARTNVARLNADGTADGSFLAPPGAYNYSLTVQPDGKVLVSGTFGVGVFRLNTNGTRDGTFVSPAIDNEVISVALQADGKILIAGTFITVAGEFRNGVARLNSDGSLDPDYAPQPNAIVPAIALQADGRTLIGGRFTIVREVPHTYLARLTSTSVAAQSLAFDGTTLTWLRDGTSPEIWSAILEATTNGSTWTNLGPMSRILGGWQKTGVSLAAGATVRARGFVTGAQFNGSSWSTETSIGPLVILTQPRFTIVNPGALAFFSVSAAGTSPITYRWFKDGVALADGENISGATTSTLALNNVLASDEGKYSVVISNEFGSTASAAARLIVRSVNDGWRFVSVTGNIGSGSGGGQMRLVIFVGPELGTALIDDISLVSGTDVPPAPLPFGISTNGGIVFTNYVRNGDFEAPLVSPVPLTNDWMVGTNYTDSLIVTSPARGNGALKLIPTSFGNSVVISSSVTNNRVIYQALSPAPAANSTNTLSFWFWATNSTTNLSVRIVNSMVGVITNINSTYQLNRASPWLDDFSVVSNQFGFNILGESNDTIVVETSSNLLQWTSLATNALTNGFLYFSDPESMQRPRRSYRAVVK